MATKGAHKRLLKEYAAIQQSSLPFIIAKPNEKNILEWHYVISGPPDSPYHNGEYHGKLVFPSQYPFAPPSIYMITPNGRFKPSTKLCLSMSDFHPGNALHSSSFV
jgi:ubiquitin-conjugating enzyme E2 J2